MYERATDPQLNGERQWALAHAVYGMGGGLIVGMVYGVPFAGTFLALPFELGGAILATIKSDGSERAIAVATTMLMGAAVGWLIGWVTNGEAEPVEVDTRSYFEKYPL